MKFGFVYPSTASYVDRELFREAVVKAEEAGFDVFFVWDHYLLPASDAHPSWTSRTLEAFEALSFAAALTEKIKLSTIVTPISFRNILLLGKMTSFLDFLSSGRFILGAGMGWNEVEFRYYSEWKSDAERFKITESGLRTLLKMWRGSTENNTLPELDPRPASSSIPIWFGTKGSQMIKLCTEIGDGWIPTSISSEEFGKKAKLIENLLKKNRRSSSDFTYAIDLEDSKLGTRSAREIISRYEKYRDAGANIICQTWQMDPKNKEEFFGKLSWFSKEVMKSF